MPRDFQRKRVYDACDLAHAGLSYSVPQELEKAEEWLRKSAMKSRTFLQHRRRDVLVLAGRWNRKYPEAFPKRSPQEIHLPPEKSVSQLQLLHELAHCIQPP